MLTIDSNLKIKELDKLCNVLIKSDIINFNIKKVGGGFPKDLSAKIINKLNYKGTVLVINDLSLEMIDELLEAGYKLEDITLAFGKWNNNGTVSDDKIMYNIMNAFIKHNIKEKLNVIFLGDIFMGIKHWNCIIANPPYGAIGANITYNIREEIDYNEYVNLLPANDYKRNKTKDLFNYQSDMEPINDGFTDAAVTTHLCLVSKNKVNNMTLDGFERSQYIDRQLDKYFEENSKRKHYAIDTATSHAPKDILFDSSLSIMFNHRTAANKHLAYSKNTAPYNINNNLMTYKEATEKFGLKNDKSNRLFDAGFIHNKTLNEKIHISAFIYSETGFRFISKVLSATNTDSWLDINKWFPKVDWTRAWTVEEILKEYSYTEEEITEVMADLDNYKYLED